MKPLALLPAALLIGSSASAQVTFFGGKYFQGNLSDSTPVVANVFMIDFVGQYTGSQVLVNLTQGRVVNIDAPFGGSNDTSPTSGAVAFKPDLVFDTFVAQGSFRSDGPNASGIPALSGGAVDIGGQPTPTFDSPTLIDQAWYPAGGANILDRTSFVTAQLTFTADAYGTLTYLASAGGELFETGVDSTERVIWGGKVYPFFGPVPPEPGMAALFGLGTLALLRRPPSGSCTT